MIYIPTLYMYWIMELDNNEEKFWNYVINNYKDIIKEEI